MEPGTHFVFGTHMKHGFIASFSPSISPHLAQWFLTREQFEPIPSSPGLFRLSEPERDGPRRTRQAVHDLRHHGYAVHAEIALDPDASASPPRPVLPNRLGERRSQLAQAAAGRTTQRGTAPATSPPAARPNPVKPSHPPNVRWPTSGGGRSR